MVFKSNMSRGDELRAPSSLQTPGIGKQAPLWGSSAGGQTVEALNLATNNSSEDTLTALEQSKYIKGGQIVTRVRKVKNNSLEKRQSPAMK